MLTILRIQPEAHFFVPHECNQEASCKCLAWNPLVSYVSFTHIKRTLGSCTWPLSLHVVAWPPPGMVAECSQASYVAAGLQGEGPRWGRKLNIP